MSPIRPGGALVLILSLALPARAQLPLAEDADWPPLRDHCRRLLKTLDELKAPLPADTDRALRALLDGRDADAAEQAQRLLDAHCLIGVSINPESRVKAARGPAEARLRQGHETVVLLKVHNQAGVTQGLRVSGPQLRAAGEDADGRWLEAAVQTDRPREQALSGRRLEYVILRLTAREAGKREATLKFDVGQGTQDLGFRAEVPVLFTVLPAER